MILSEEEQESRAAIGSDHCIIDEERFFVRGCIEIQVEGEEQPFAWGAWVDVSKSDFEVLEASFGQERRTHLGPFAGYLANALPGYPETLNLHVVVHQRDDGIRPFIEVRPCDHPLHREQCEGMSAKRLEEIYTLVMHSA